MSIIQNVNNPFLVEIQQIVETGPSWAKLAQECLEKWAESYERLSQENVQEVFGYLLEGRVNYNPVNIQPKEFLVAFDRFHLDYSNEGVQTTLRRFNCSVAVDNLEISPELKKLVKQQALERQMKDRCILKTVINEMPNDLESQMTLIQLYVHSKPYGFLLRGSESYLLDLLKRVVLAERPWIEISNVIRLIVLVQNAMLKSTPFELEYNDIFWEGLPAEKRSLMEEEYMKWAIEICPSKVSEWIETKHSRMESYLKRHQAEVDEIEKMIQENLDGSLDRFNRIHEIKAHLFLIKQHLVAMKKLPKGKDANTIFSTILKKINKLQSLHSDYWKLAGSFEILTRKEVLKSFLSFPSKDSSERLLLVLNLLKQQPIWNIEDPKELSKYIRECTELVKKIPNKILKDPRNVIKLIKCFSELNFYALKKEQALALVRQLLSDTSDIRTRCTLIVSLRNIDLDFLIQEKPLSDQELKNKSIEFINHFIFYYENETVKQSIHNYLQSRDPLFVMNLATFTHSISTKLQHDPQRARVHGALYQILIALADGTFQDWIPKMSRHWLVLQHCTTSYQPDIEKGANILNSWLRLEQKGPFDAAEQTPLTKDLILEITSHPETILMAPYYTGGCQNMTEDIGFSKAALGNIDPSVKVIVVKNAEGRIIARAFVRLQLDQKTQKYAFLLEPTYTHFTQISTELIEGIQNFARSIAEALETPLACNWQSYKYPEERQQIELGFYQTIAPYVYSDSYGINRQVIGLISGSEDSTLKATVVYAPLAPREK